MSEKHTHDHCRFDDAEESSHDRILFDFPQPAKRTTLIDLVDSELAACYQIKNIGLKAFYVKGRESSTPFKIKPDDAPLTFYVDWKLIISPVANSHMKGWIRYVGRGELDAPNVPQSQIT